MFVERIIFDTLTDGLAYYTEDSQRLYRWLVSEGISETEAEKARKYFTNALFSDRETGPPAPIMGYARPGGPFPAWAIILGNESTEQDYIGEDALNLDEDGLAYFDDATGDPVDMKIRRWGHRFDVYCYVDHADVCLYYYYLLRKLMVENRHTFQSAGIDEITYQGAELAPDGRYLPSDVYIRRLSMNCRADQTYDDRGEFRGAGLARKVDAFIKSSEALSPLLTAEQVAEMQSIIASVTTYAEGE